MSDHKFPHLKVKDDPDDLLQGLVTWRKDLRHVIACSLSKMDAAAPTTLQSAVASMMEAHYKPKTLSKVLGPSQTTISRWADGQTIPRSAPYRKWLVQTLIAFLRENSEAGVDNGAKLGVETIEAPKRPRRRPNQLKSRRKSSS